MRWERNSMKFQKAYTQTQEHDLAKTKAQLKSVIVGRTVLQDQLYHTTKLGMLISRITIYCT